MNANEWIKIIGYLVDIIRVVAWPVTIFLIVKKFEVEIKALIDHIKISLSFGDKKLEISHQEKPQLERQQENASGDKEIKKIKEENKKNKDNETNLLELEQLDNTAKTKDTLFLLYHFEKSYRLIFGSQLSILNLIYQYGKITDVLTSAIYRRTTWVNTYPYEQYIGFLINSGFITPLDSSNQSYYILPVGKSFIEYLSANNMSLNKLPY